MAGMMTLANQLITRHMTRPTTRIARCAASPSPLMIFERTPIMYTKGYANRSYFYRTHRTCAIADTTGSVDGMIFDMIAANGD